MSCHPIEAKLGHGTFLWHLDKSFWKYKPATNIQAKNITGWYIAVRPIAEVALLCSKSPLMFPSVCLKKCFDLWFPLFCYYKKKNPPAVTTWKHETCGILHLSSWTMVPHTWLQNKHSLIPCEGRTVFLAFTWAISHLARRMVYNSYKLKEAFRPQEDPGRCVYGTHSQFCTWGEKVVIRRGPFILGLGSPPLPHGL